MSFSRLVARASSFEISSGSDVGSSIVFTVDRCSGAVPIGRPVMFFRSLGRPTLFVRAVLLDWRKKNSDFVKKKTTIVVVENFGRRSRGRVGRAVVPNL